MDTLPFIIVNMLFNFVLLWLFLRFLLQFAQINARNPVAKAVYRSTSVVDVFSRILPTVGGGRINLAVIVLMLLLYLINMLLVAIILKESITALELFFAGSLSAVIQFLSMLRYTLVASVVCSWIVMFTQTNNGLVALIMELAEPIVAPFRRFVPNLGMLDLSFIVALFSLLLFEKFIGIIGKEILRML